MADKLFWVTYRAEVKRKAAVFAKSEKDARKKFDDGDIDDETEVDCYDIDDVCIHAADDET